MRRANHLRRRGAFTLVELLIVITILGIMFALTAAAVVRALSKGDEVKVRSELSQLTMAVKAFQQDMHVSYMPDTLVLPPGNDQASRQYITSLWPRINPAFLNNDATGRAYWQAGAQQRVLRGHQTLVFFLGGYREGAASTGLGGDPVGFCSDPTNPMKPTAPGVTRKQPHYEFPSDRLRVYPPSNDPTMPYPSFRDVYDKAPYLYFSSGASGNDYSAAPSPLFTYQDDANRPAPANVQPFMLRAAPSVRFANPSGFQIISAGRDTRFGVGGTTWAGGIGIGNNKDGIDDMANFHATQLGIAGN